MPGNFYNSKYWSLTYREKFFFLIKNGIGFILAMALMTVLGLIPRQMAIAVGSLGLLTCIIQSIYCFCRWRIEKRVERES
jgi:hypothetical protein